jgi:hypothetical protein
MIQLVAIQLLLLPALILRIATHIIVIIATATAKVVSFHIIGCLMIFVFMTAIGTIKRDCSTVRGLLLFTGILGDLKAASTSICNSNGGSTPWWNILLKLLAN